MSRKTYFCVRLILDLFFALRKVKTFKDNVLKLTDGVIWQTIFFDCLSYFLGNILFAKHTFSMYVEDVASSVIWLHSGIPLHNIYHLQ